MKYVNKSFSVGMFANGTQPKCICGRGVRVITQQGGFCDDCFIKRKEEERKAKIKKELEGLSPQETDS